MCVGLRTSWKDVDTDTDTVWFFIPQNVSTKKLVSSS